MGAFQNARCNAPNCLFSHGAWPFRLPGARASSYRSIVPAVGELIADRYRLDEQVSSSAMGSVWRATHVGLHKSVSVEIMTARAASDAKRVERFDREAVLAAKIKSEHVVRIDDHGHHGGLPFIVMEYAAGETLRRLLGAVGCLDLRDTAEIVRQACSALGAAHEVGLVHRDIKPENILVGQTAVDGEYRIRVVDFGTAKLGDTIGPRGMQLPGTEDVVGTPYYLSPEQARGEVEIGPAADLWALAVVTFECLTGQRPFNDASIAPLIRAITEGDIPPPSRFVHDLPDGIDAWFEAVLRREPSERFGSARAMSRAFHLASELDGRAASIELPSALSLESLDCFDSLSVTTRTVVMDPQPLPLAESERTHEMAVAVHPPELLPDSEPTRVRRSGAGALEPVVGEAVPAAEPSDGPVTVRAHGDQRPAVAQAGYPPIEPLSGGYLPVPPMGAEDAHTQPESESYLPMVPASDGYPPPQPLSDGLPGLPAIPPPMRVPEQPAPMTVRPAMGAYAPASGDPLPPWQEPSVVPMQKSRQAWWMAALVMVLLGGGAAFALGSGVLDESTVSDNDDGESSQGAAKRKKRRGEASGDASSMPDAADSAPVEVAAASSAAVSAAPSSSTPTSSTAPKPASRPDAIPRRGTRPRPAAHPAPAKPASQPPAPGPGSHRRTLD